MQRWVLFRAILCSDSQVYPMKSRITADPESFPSNSMQRFPNLPHEIQNHCRPRVISEQSMQRFPNLPHEIQNHCRHKAFSGQFFAAIPKFTHSNQESLQKRGRFRAIPCSDSQIYPMKSRITAAPESFPGNSMQRFPSLPHEIKNHCRQKAFSGQFLAAIHKFTP